MPLTVFQSAPLLRGAIRRYRTADMPLEFQSAPLLRGAMRLLMVLGHEACFNPRPSCEGRLLADLGQLQK